MKTIMICLALLTSVNSFAGNMAFYGGKDFAAHRSDVSSSPGWNFGVDDNFAFVGPLSASIILDHTIYSVEGRDADHITSLIFSPTVEIQQGALRVFAGLGVGAQLNVITQWTYMDGANRISYDNSTPKLALVIVPRAGVDYLFSETGFIGVQGAFHVSKYTREGFSYDAGGVSTPLSDSISQTFFNASVRIGWNF